MDKYLAEKDIILNAPMKVQSIEAVKRCVMNNLGIAVVPTYSIGEELKSGSLMPKLNRNLIEKKYILFISIIKISGLARKWSWLWNLMKEYLGNENI